MENLDLRVQKTYKLLLYAFENLLAEKDFEEISVTELSKEAMVGRPTFYKHFLDKYDFLSFFIQNKMKEIFDEALRELNEGSDDDFFVLVFKELLKQPDNLLSLIFSLQMRSDISFELEDIQDYGQEMLKNYANLEEKNENLGIIQDYQRQIIMSITIQSIQWYKSNKDKISQDEMIDLYKQSLKKLQ